MTALRSSRPRARALGVLAALAFSLTSLTTTLANADPAASSELPPSDPPPPDPPRPDPPRPAYKLETKVDLPLLLIAGGVTASFFILDEAPGVACGLQCDRSKVNAFDRWAAGRYDEGWGHVGDIATAATIAFGPALLLIDRGIVNGSQDTLVVMESGLLSAALQVTMSYAIARPRPRSYAAEAPAEERTDANAARSFFSGHIAFAVATTVATARAYATLGKPVTSGIVLGAGLAGSTLVGVGRVLSGGHFPSDVLVGAAVGAGFGILVPALHTANNVRILPQSSGDGAGLGVAGVF